MKSYKVTWVLALVASIGCDLSRVDPGGGAATKSLVTVKTTASATAPGATTDQPGTAVAETGSPGSVTGTITLDGMFSPLAPKVAKGAPVADPTICGAKGPIPDESMVVGAGNGIQNVFVFLDKAPKGYTASEGASLAVDQKDCIFLPHAGIARVGVPVELRNSESGGVAHNVQTAPGRNSSMNDNVPGGQSMTVVFKKAETKPFLGKCSIHAWMSFWLLVVDHPFAAVSGPDGKFEIKDLPPGKHKLRVFHERGEMLQTVDVEIKSGQSTNLDLKYKPEKFKL